MHLMQRYIPNKDKILQQEELHHQSAPLHQLHSRKESLLLMRNHSVSIQSHQ